MFCQRPETPRYVANMSWSSSNNVKETPVTPRLCVQVRHQTQQDGVARLVGFKAWPAANYWQTLIQLTKLHPRPPLLMCLFFSPTGFEELRHAHYDCIAAVEVTILICVLQSSKNSLLLRTLKSLAVAELAFISITLFEYWIPKWHVTNSVTVVLWLSACPLSLDMQ